MVTASVASLDGREFHTARRDGLVASDDDAIALGVDVGSRLKAAVPPRLLQ